jgi:hypothetical protein
MTNLGDLELRTCERSLSKADAMPADAMPSRRDELAQSTTVLAVHSYPLDIEEKSQAAPATGQRRKLWPWAWLAVTGLATLGWLFAIGWAAVELVHWLAD